MKAGFALLVDGTLHNLIRKLAFELNRDYRIGFRASLVPPHISLKQPFLISDVAAVEAYFDSFAAGIRPFDVALQAVEVHPAAGPTGDLGVVWIKVSDSRTLRGLHTRLNAELAERFPNTQADFDGPAYQFHATIVAGGQPPDVYRQIAATLRPPALPRTCRMREVMMCYFDDDSYALGTYSTYKILPLGGKAQNVTR
jgi:2'-5' RNA ligase